jgi:hypothetical protein
MAILSVTEKQVVTKDPAEETKEEPMEETKEEPSEEPSETKEGPSETKEEPSEEPSETKEEPREPSIEKLIEEINEVSKIFSEPLDETEVNPLLNTLHKKKKKKSKK